MVKIPKEAANVFHSMQTVKVLATVDKNGMPHAVPIGSLDVSRDGDKLYFAEVAIKKTKANLELAKKEGKMVSVVAVKALDAFQAKCTVQEFYTSGDIYEQQNKALKMAMNLDIIGVWVLEPKEVYRQSVRPREDIGKRIA
jgi:predicted pyridoxine 5'-phosphate oxidase superfamily flavin-nucleotide-binding protein